MALSGTWKVGCLLVLLALLSTHSRDVFRHNWVTQNVFCFSVVFFSGDGISIPMSYTSYLAPLSSAKLHYEVSQCREPNKGTNVWVKDKAWLSLSVFLFIGLYPWLSPTLCLSCFCLSTCLSISLSLHLFLSPSLSSSLSPSSFLHVCVEINVMLKVNVKCYQAPFETPYVVRLSNVDIVAEPKPCFHFVHPNRGKVTRVWRHFL